MLSLLQALALCMDRGPLKDAHSLAQAVVLYILPVHPSQGGHISSQLVQ